MSSSPFSAWPFSMPSAQPSAYAAPVYGATAQASAYAAAPAPAYIPMPSYAPPAQQQPASPFSNWVFSVPPRAQQPTYQQPSYTAPSYPAATATAYAGAYPATPQYTQPQPSYAPYAAANSYASSYPTLNSLSSLYAPSYPMAYQAAPAYPTTPSYQPPAMPYAAASASANSSGGLNQLLQLLLPLLLSKLGNQGGYNNQPPANYPPAGGYDDKPPAHSEHHNHDHGNDHRNINGNDDQVVNNYIVNPDNVNISGVNTGVQKNIDDNDNDIHKPKTPEYAATAKDEKGKVGNLLAPGTKGTDGKYKGKEFPPGSYGSTDGHHKHVYTVDPETQKVDVLQSPLTLDLNGDGKINTTAENRSDIDIDADGQKDNISKIKDDGMLFIDPNHTGKITSGTQLLGNHTNGGNFANGFDALKAVAKEALGEEAIADGKLDATELKQLEAKTGLGIEVNNQMKSLEEAGITELSLNFDDTKQADGLGNEVRQVSTAKKDGQDIQLADIWFKKQ